MNEIVDKVAEVTPTIEAKHYVIGLDDKGNEVRIEVLPNGEFSQDIEEQEVPATVH